MGEGDMTSQGLPNHYFLLADKTFESLDQAVNFCESISKACQKYNKNSDDDFTEVGLSTWSIPQAAWGSLAVKYEENNEIQWTQCSNRNTKRELVGDPLKVGETSRTEYFSLDYTSYGSVLVMTGIVSMYIPVFL